MGKGPKLNGAQQTFLVTRLACFCSQSQARREFAEEFGFEITLRRVSHYDPTLTGSTLHLRLRTLFHETRERFTRDVSAIPIAHRAYRLRRLQELIDDEANRPTAAFVRDVLIEAEKITGNHYTNRREVTGKGGGPVQFDFAGWTDEALEEYARGGKAPTTGPGAAATRPRAESAGAAEA